ncbi:radical SAM/SPASM domain-containing protein [Paraclostridium sordellii]|uniref:radical SAM/SPASM domain-containing protein n=1 Tax=Paraclostridium sordellii TaxID=1505 RepID=UPI00189B1070|nr:radical SAM protein [Paeniclostridium sordellii]MCR1850904.1 radical SAM protein [Paeniclostridium sordellii]
MLDKKYFIKELCNYHIDSNIVYISNKYTGEWLKIPKEIFELLINSQKEKKYIKDIYDFILDNDDKKYFYQVIERLDKIGVLYDKPNFKRRMNQIPKIVVSLTNKCNLRCNYCSVDSKIENNKGLSFLEIKNMFDKIVKLSPKRIVISGGEPMLRDDFFEILKYLKNVYEGKIQLATNATYINDSNIEQLLKYIYAFDISLDGYDEESCSKMRGDNVFKKVTESIKGIQKLGCKNISVSMVLGKNNIEDADSFCSFCESINVNPVLRGFFNMGRGTFNSNIYLDNVNDVKYYLPSSDCKEDSSFSRANICRAGENQLFVNYDGNIYPCPLLQGQEYLICNVRDLNDTLINDILNCDYEVLKNVDKIRTCNYKKCKECRYSIFCNNCLGIMDSMIKDEKVFEHNCRKMKAIFEKEELLV